MIVKFSIENYRCIKDEITLSFEADKSDFLSDYYMVQENGNLKILKIGLIYGANASGKTTILESLNFLRYIVLHPFETKNEKFDFEPFLFNNENKNKTTKFKLIFFYNNVKYDYRIELIKDSIISEELIYYSPFKAHVFERTTDIKKQITKINFGSKIKLSAKQRNLLEGNTLWNNSVLSGYLKTNIELKELQDVVNWFGDVLKPLVLPNTKLVNYISSKINEGYINKNILIKLLNKADFGISDIIFENNDTELSNETVDFLSKSFLIPQNKKNEIIETRKINLKKITFRHSILEDTYDLPFEDESAGTKRYYELGGLLAYILKNNLVLPIDEIESSLHPDLIKHFLLTFLTNSDKSQLIMTTHYRELLMEKDILRNDIIWFTERNKDFAVDLYSLSDFNYKAIRKTSSIYNMYKIGRLGAVPNLKDYFLDF